MGILYPRVYFDGTNSTDVKEDIFMYDNVCMREQREDENASSLFGFLEGEATASIVLG